MYKQYSLVNGLFFFVNTTYVGVEKPCPWICWAWELTWVYILEWVMIEMNETEEGCAFRQYVLATTRLRPWLVGARIWKTIDPLSTFKPTSQRPPL